MQRSLLSSFVLVTMLTAATANAMSQPATVSLHEESRINQLTFQNGMRKLWEDHITWTRLYIISALGDLPDKAATTTRLLQNQTDIGNAIKPLYGDAAGDKLTALLRDHILLAAELISTVQSGNTVKSRDVSARWDKNADEIAQFLSNANPKYWALGEMKSMMHSHLSNTTAEVAARIHNDWAGDIAAYDRVHQQILEMADMLSSGIMMQFPSRFK